MFSVGGWALSQTHFAYAAHFKHKTDKGTENTVFFGHLSKQPVQIDTARTLPAFKKPPKK
ncbi:MAG: hypothetical protein CTY16_15440 [Methylobacter sp.]|nr:MAG: hypothetical protein CTY16_15440 [Methylobacter sp.]